MYGSSRRLLGVLGFLSITSLLCIDMAAAIEASPDPTLYIGTPRLKNLWVDPVHGLDSRSGATRRDALRTITAAWNRVPETPEGNIGSRIHLVAGEYTEADFPVFWENRHGSLRAPIVIDSVDGEGKARLRGSLNFFDVAYLYLIGLNVSVAGDVLHCERCDHLLLRRSTFTGGHRQAHETIKMNQSRFIYIEDSDIGQAYENAIDFVAVQHGHIVRNHIHDGDDWCMYLKGGSAYFRIEGNRIDHCGTGGFTAGQGTGFEYMVPPWLHHEAYALRIVNNIISDTQSAGLGVNGGYDILLAYNTLYRVGAQSHVLEFVFGGRSCDGDSTLAGQCAAHLALGGWGTTRLDQAEPIPNRNVYAYNNLIYNPRAATSRWQQFAIHGPLRPSPASNIPSPARTDTNLSIRSNLIANGPADHPLGLGEGSGCQPTNASCNHDQLLRDNRINTMVPDLIAPEAGDLRPIPGGRVESIAGMPIPAFGAWSRFTPSVPPADLRNTVGVDFNRMTRKQHSAIGAFASGDSARGHSSAPSEIYGSVADDGYAPLVGVTVELLRQNTAGKWDSARQTSTDSLGEFRFAGLKPAGYRLRVTPVGRTASYWPGVAGPAQAWTIPLPPATSYLVDITPID
ncbi:MAG: right-handed parallel beta-helix repeat-containing protein [Methylotetracoccus sp.]